MTRDQWLILVQKVALAMANNEGEPFEPQYRATVAIWTDRAEIAVDTLLKELDIKVDY